MVRISVLWVAATAMLALALALPAPAGAHAERTSIYPNFDPATKTYMPAFGSVPRYRATGGRLMVVCKRDSRSRVLRTQHGKLRRRSLALLHRCRFRNIETAVQQARSNARIYVMPGVYDEEPSAKAPDEDPACADLFTSSDSGTRVKSYEYHYKCPKADNLIAIMGDGPDADRRCDVRCNIQIVGMGRLPSDVLISGERTKLNVIRADRADGVYLSNFKVRYSDFNNIYALETNGFHFNRIVSGYSREYGFLSFASDNGLYENLDAYGSGDSGIYPGSGPEGHCKRYGIEIRFSDSHDNNLGYSGTAGNGVWAHDNKFHDNGTGMVTDSFAAGHPGMPQDCAKWENNQIYSNNKDLFNPEMDKYCKKPYTERDPARVCPTFQNPVGTGMLIAGGNGNIIRGNRIWDNWRQGVGIFWVPQALRGDDSSGQSINDGNQFDTSNKNQVTGNLMGVDPSGRRDPNGVDFWWDEEGAGNCWSGNTPAASSKIKSDPATLPGCPKGSLFSTGNPVKQATAVPCATWNPTDNTDPAGCDWFDRPPEPK